ncbi:MAG: HAD family hydrolase, partial [Clostridia bacterium]|nr:HAD family hydrolase [Clostridia bacterium]
KKGVREFLERLFQNSVKMCIATVADKYLVEAALIRLNVRGYFSEIFTTAEIGCGKSNPQIYRTALAHLGTEKSETLVFEDAYHALITAKKDGFPIAAVYDKHEEKQAEMEVMADHYITDFTKFLFESF